MGNGPSAAGPRQLTAEERKAVFPAEPAPACSCCRRRNAGGPTVENLGRTLGSMRFQRVVVVCGAGISVSCGVPDFRTPGSGIYDNLHHLGLENPEDVFSLSFFRENPAPFFSLVKEMFPGQLSPSIAHAFIKLLHAKGILLRVYTQNVDGLEALAGIPQERIVACHGSLASGTCTRCGAKYDQQWMRTAVGSPAPSSCGAVDAAAVPIPRCSAGTPSGETCSGVVKPDITFFEEALPRAFTRQHKADMASADCVLVLGTSLSVQPVWRKGGEADAQGGWGGAVNPFLFGHPENYRDVLLLGDVDEAVAALAIAAGWEGDLAQQVTESRKHAALQATGVERDPSSPPPGREVQEALVAGRRLLAQWRALPGGQAALPEDFSDSEGAAGAMGSTGASGAAPPGAQEPAALATAENPSKPTCPLPPYRNVDSANTPSGRAGAKTHGLSELEIAMGLDDDEWA